MHGALSVDVAPKLPHDLRMPWLSLRLGRVRLSGRGVSARFGRVRVGTRWPSSRLPTTTDTPLKEFDVQSLPTVFLAGSNASDAMKSAAITRAAADAAATLPASEVAAISAMTDDEADEALRGELETLRTTDPPTYQRIIDALPTEDRERLLAPSAPADTTPPPTGPTATTPATGHNDDERLASLQAREQLLWDQERVLFQRWIEQIDLDNAEPGFEHGTGGLRGARSSPNRARAAQGRDRTPQRLLIFDTQRAASYSNRAS